VRLAGLPGKSGVPVVCQDAPPARAKPGNHFPFLPSFNIIKLHCSMSRLVIKAAKAESYYRAEIRLYRELFFFLS
jgi:hypothetical protein